MACGSWSFLSCCRGGPTCPPCGERYALDGAWQLIRGDGGMAAHSLFQNKSPSPSGRERCFAATKPWINGAAWAPDQVRDMPRLAGAKRPWPGDSSSPFHWLNSDSPDEAGHAGRDPGSMPEEKPGLCFCSMSTLERRGVSILPLRQRAEN